MHLTLNDLVATISAIGVVLVTLAVVGEWGWPILGSVRVGAAAVLLLSMGMCAAGNAADGGPRRAGDPYVRFMAGFGIVILAAAIVAFITASEAWLVTESAMVVAMWVISTIRHAFVAGPRPVPTH